MNFRGVVDPSMNVIPDYLLQSCKSTNIIEEKRLKNAVIKRIMAFRGRGTSFKIVYCMTLLTRSLCSLCRSREET
jgi:hypothetical protein